MKKVLIILVLFVSTFNAYSQQSDKSFLVNGGYVMGKNSNYDALSIGLTGRYNISDNIRLAPSVDVWFDDEYLVNTSIDGHYMVNLTKELNVYPLAGLNIFGSRFGLNIGAGADYNINPKSYVNIQSKYGLHDFDNDIHSLSISIGYGIKF